MGILEGLVSGFGQAISFEVLPYLIVGSIFGLIIGIIPGLSGHFAMAMLIPFLYKMDPAPGIAFLLAAHATVAQGGGLTAILFSTPGTGQNAATLLDGPPMREQGKAGVAVGAAMTACFLGATFGAIALALLLPVLQQVVLFFGPPEIFVSVISRANFYCCTWQGRYDPQLDCRSSWVCWFSMIGIDNVTNQERFTPSGLLELYDGLPSGTSYFGLICCSRDV